MGVNGDSRSVDMTVKDIYGENFMKGFLDGDLIASSFGKATMSNIEKEKINFPADVVRSVFIMTTINIAQLTMLYSQIERIQRVIFVSSLLRNETLFALIQVIFFLALFIIFLVLLIKVGIAIFYSERS